MTPAILVIAVIAAVTGVITGAGLELFKVRKDQSLAVRIAKTIVSVIIIILGAYFISGIAATIPKGYEVIGLVVDVLTFAAAAYIGIIAIRPFDL